MSSGSWQPALLEFRDSSGTLPEASGSFPVAFREVFGSLPQIVCRLMGLVGSSVRPLKVWSRGSYKATPGTRQSMRRRS